MNNKTTNVRYLAQLALLAAIEVVMKLMGLGSVPVGPLYMSFLTVPIAVGAMTMGPTAGAILGGVGGFLIARGYSRKFAARAEWQPIILSVALPPGLVRFETSSEDASQ